MTGLIQNIQQQQRKESHQQVEAHLLATQLAKLRGLRDDEVRLRARVALLETQAAALGPLQRKADLAEALRTEQSVLQRLRNELEARQEDVVATKDLPAATRLHLRAERLDEHISDLKARRQQARLHQRNVLYLEEKLARLGDEATLNIVNELSLCQDELKQVTAQLAALHSRLQIEWQLSTTDIPNLEDLNEKQIMEFALEVVARRERDSHAVFLGHMSDAVTKLDGIVTALLKELQASAYPSGGLSSPVAVGGLELSLVRSDLPPHESLDLFVRPPTWESRKRVLWSVRERGSFMGVEVELVFDAFGQPREFQCRRYVSDPKPVREISSNVDRESLKAALAQLHRTAKVWWNFWRSTPSLPESWR